MWHRHLTPEAVEKLKQSQLTRCRNPNLADVVERNICTILDMRRQAEESKSLQERAADRITAFSGSMAFVYIHIVWFALWVCANVNWPGRTWIMSGVSQVARSVAHVHLAANKPFDPFPFGLLTLIVSLEAIFLSTFVLISQNRMGATADQRADLDLQINLLAEHEITRILSLVDAIGKNLGIDQCVDPEMTELEKDISPDILLNELRDRQNDRQGHTKKPEP